MMSNIKKPCEVNQSKFPVNEEDVLYSGNHYDLAVSYYDGRDYKCLGIRWQGDEESPQGFPSTGTTSTWMIVPDELALPILARLSLIHI